MAAAQVLRIKRTDTGSNDDFVLINVSSNGSQTLDLKLLGTDNEAKFVATIQSKRIGGLRAKNYNGSEDEWAACLAQVFLQQRTDSTTASAEAVANADQSQLNIIIRRNIGGITQRLGSIALSRDDNQGDDLFNLFNWAGIAVSGSDTAHDQLVALQASLGQQQDQVVKLTAQLDDLVRAKKEHEEALLQKFAALLNAKKLKIRDQQRLLAGAKVDPEAAAAISSARGGTGKRESESSRSGKRKANGTAAADLMEDDDDLNIDDDELLRQAETPEHSDRDATDDEDSDADGFAPAPAASQASKRGVGAKGKALEVAEDKVNQDDTDKMEVEDVNEPPPKRELPFARSTRVQTAAKPPEPQPEEDDETDDEL